MSHRPLQVNFHAQAFPARPRSPPLEIKECHLIVRLGHQFKAHCMGACTSLLRQRLPRLEVDRISRFLVDKVKAHPMISHRLIVIPQDEAVFQGSIQAGRALPRCLALDSFPFLQISLILL